MQHNRKQREDGMGRINEEKSTARVLGEVYTFDWRAPQGAEGLLEKSSHLVVASQLCGPQPIKKIGSQLGGKKTKQELDNRRGFSAGLEGDSKMLFTSTAVTAFGM